MEKDFDNIILRTVTEADAEELLAIYAPYVTDTAITFEYDVPSLDEFRERIKNIVQKYPYIAAVHEGKIAGYAYAGAFKERAAYDRAVETTVYVDKNMKRCGIGSLLYEALEKSLAVQGIINANACIGYPDGSEDEYMPYDSAEFHKCMGYRLVGEFVRCGYKFGRWYNMIWMEKHLGDHSADPAPVKTFPEIAGKMEKQFHVIEEKWNEKMRNAEEQAQALAPADTAYSVNTAAGKTDDSACVCSSVQSDIGGVRTVTAAQMKQIEKNAYDGGMMYIQMMENAGRAAYAEIRRRFPEARDMTVIVGKGNNGGDGYVVARLAALDGISVKVIQAEGAPVTADAAENLRRMQELKISALQIEEMSDADFKAASECSVMVDALYGTGFHGKLRESGAKACALMNLCGCTVALDCPSGVNADTAEAAAGAVNAGLTIVFDSYKKMHLVPGAMHYCGEIKLVDIGIPEECHENI